MAIDSASNRTGLHEAPFSEAEWSGIRFGGSNPFGDLFEGELEQRLRRGRSGNLTRIQKNEVSLAEWKAFQRMLAVASYDQAGATERKGRKKAHRIGSKAWEYPISKSRG